MSDDPQMLRAAVEAGYLRTGEYIERAPKSAGQRLLSAAQEMRAGLHIAALEAAIAAAKPRRAWHETDQPPPSEPVVELPLSLAKAVAGKMREMMGKDQA